MSDTDRPKWDVRVEQRDVVVELPRRLSLETWGKERLADAVAAAVVRDVERVVVLVRVDDPLSDALVDALADGARAAAAEDVTDWHVVADTEPTARAVARAIPAVDITVGTDEQQPLTPASGP